MTERDLDKANGNRDRKRRLLIEYKRVSEAIEKFDDDGFAVIMRYKTWERGEWTDLDPSLEELRTILISMRDRLDVEISKIDKEFAGL